MSPRCAFVRCAGAGRALVLALLCSLPLSLALQDLHAAAAPAASGAVQIRVLSTRADLVSGGEALIAVQLPSGTDPSAARITAGGE